MRENTQLDDVRAHHLADADFHALSGNDLPLANSLHGKHLDSQASHDRLAHSLPLRTRGGRQPCNDVSRYLIGRLDDRRGFPAAFRRRSPRSARHRRQHSRPHRSVKARLLRSSPPTPASGRRVADQIDPRLQKASLSRVPRTSEKQCHVDVRESIGWPESRCVRRPESLKLSSETLRLLDSQTPRLPDSQTPRLPDSSDSFRLPDSPDSRNLLLDSWTLRYQSNPYRLIRPYNCALVSPRIGCLRFVEPRVLKRLLDHRALHRSDVVRRTRRHYRRPAAGRKHRRNSSVGRYRTDRLKQMRRRRRRVSARCSAGISPPSHRIAARSRMLRSSRTLPGQW